LLARISVFLVAIGPLGALLLSFIDSAGLPLPVGADGLVVLVGYREPERVWVTALLAVIGSVAGNLLLYYLAYRGGRKFAERKAGTSQPEKSQRLQKWFDRYGLVTVFIPAVVPIPLPLKVFVISAGVLRTRVAPFTAVILTARVIRYFGLAWVAVQLGEDARHFLKHNTGKLAIAAAVLAAVLFLVVKLKDGRRTAAAGS
jgi:membrane protein YqaA with SNARE-associated domain